jgi:branched-subunit amino acid transport protein AzlD
LKSILPVFDSSYILDILKQSAPYALLVLLMMLYNRSDVVILKQISSDGNYQAGIYAQGYRLLDAFYMLGMIFAGLLFPVFSRMIHQQSKDLMALVQVAGKLLIGGAIGILFIVNYNGSYILHLIYGDKVDNESITVFWVWLLNEFWKRNSTDKQSFEQVCNAFLKSKYCDRAAAFTFYTREKLLSREARLTFVEPDMQAFNFDIL